MRQFYTYILFNQSRTLYVGMTNDLIARTYRHKTKSVPGFTAKYNVTQLAYFESYPTAMGAIEREKQIKGWKREKKIKLIEQMNPRWEDLADTLKEKFSPESAPPPFCEPITIRHSDGATATEESARNNHPLSQQPDPSVATRLHQDDASPSNFIKQSSQTNRHSDGATATEESASYNRPFNDRADSLGAAKLPQNDDAPIKTSKP